ncbi:MAG: FkbM family methyltransferase [Chitinophagaceae bacterium]
MRTLLKPILFKVLGTKGYKWVQFQAKKKDISNRLVEEIEMQLLPRIVGKSDEVIDIGANYAYYTERLSRLVPDGRVYAFEPIPFTYDVAMMIIRSYRLKNVRLFQKGVGEKNETMRFKVPKMDFGSLSAGQAHMAARDNTKINNTVYYVSEKNEEFDCEVVSIDSFLLPELKNVSFIKIDIEGAEYFALKGMSKTLSRFKPVILIEIVPVFLKSFNIDIEEFQSYLANDLGYNIYKYDDKSKMLYLSADLKADRNYILIHSDKLHQYAHLIATYE